MIGFKTKSCPMSYCTILKYLLRLESLSRLKFFFNCCSLTKIYKSKNVQFLESSILKVRFIIHIYKGKVEIVVGDKSVFFYTCFILRFICLCWTKGFFNAFEHIKKCKYIPFSSQSINWSHEGDMLQFKLSRNEIISGDSLQKLHLYKRL